MDDAAVHTLNALNRDFYEAHGRSFSHTRQGPWPGWERIVDSLARRWAGKGGLSLCDVAAGNGRFESYAVAAYPEIPWAFTCLDGNGGLLREAAAREELEPYPLQIIEGDALGDAAIPAVSAGFDAVVSFGFLHHIPGAAAREAFIGACLDTLAPGGLGAFSFWRFADDEAMARKAAASTERASGQMAVALELGDYLLGWQGDETRYRYCHSFDDSELDRLVVRLGSAASLVDRFKADGRNGMLNEYLVFAAKPSVP